MNKAIKLILSLSLSGSLLAGLIFALKPLIRCKLSKSIQYYIWIVVLLRLVVPFSSETSIMNKVFYMDQATVTIDNPGEAYIDETSVLPGVREKVARGFYDGDVDHSRYLKDLINENALKIWLLGVIATLAFNIIEYIRFFTHLKAANLPASDEENMLLRSLSEGRYEARLLRNSMATTPMLLGILRPLIIIPDIDYSKKQLKNILLHELTHLRRFDIGVKWLTMMVTSLHWFNPLMYFIKKEINRACELACDEAVIRNLNSTEKQDYGDTLISVVSENRYPAGVLQATMSEEKDTLKERLVAIMQYSKKTKAVVLASAVLLIAIIIGAVALGASVAKTREDVVYQNNNFGFLITASKDFMEDTVIKEEDNVVYFMSKAIQENAADQIFGVVGRIEVYDKAQRTKEEMMEAGDSYSLRFLGENDKYYFGWAYSTDVQVPYGEPELADKYRAMEKEFGDIVKTFDIPKN